MKDLEYFIIEVKDELPHDLNQEDFADAVANMNAKEFLNMRLYLSIGSARAAMQVIISSIIRQYDSTIEEKAKERLKAYLDDAKAESDEDKLEARRSA